MALARQPARYIGIERDDRAAQQVARRLTAPQHQCRVGRAEKTTLPDASATVIFGEAMLTMQSPTKKRMIVQEAARVLRPGGRYGVHEMCLCPDDLPDALKEEIRRTLSAHIRVGARPLTSSEWRAVLEAEGFTVTTVATAPMHLLEPMRFLQDEGLAATLRFILRVARMPTARRRILKMRATFRKYAPYLGAITLVGEKRADGR